MDVHQHIRNRKLLGFIAENFDVENIVINEILNLSLNNAHVVVGKDGYDLALVYLDTLDETVKYLIPKNHRKRHVKTSSKADGCNHIQHLKIDGKVVVREWRGLRDRERLSSWIKGELPISKA